MLSAFVQKARAVSAEVESAPEMGHALQRALELTQEAGGKKLGACALAEAEMDALPGLCAASGVELVTQGLKAHEADLCTGLTMADWGIAETGTLVINCPDEDLRLATMLPELHVAILPAGRIRQSLKAISGELGAYLNQPPDYLAFITGPSRTADIERALTIGVHGPGRLCIIILEEPAP